MSSRRDFITLLGGAAATWPAVAHGQHRRRLRTVGILGVSTPSAWGQWVSAFVQRMRELGWIEGRTVAIEVRWAEGRSERYDEIAAEFVRSDVDVIVTGGSAVLAARRATSAIPIVFAIGSEPVGSGMVAALARPEGNVTGLSLQASDLASKRVELLGEMLPGLRRLSIMANVHNPSSVLEGSEVRAAAHQLGLDVHSIDIQVAHDIEAAFVSLKPGAQAIYLCGDALLNANRSRISMLALEARVPTISNNRGNTEHGGLMSYGPNVADLFRRAADFVDKIFRGAKPAEIPVEQPTKFELVINLKTAKALGIEIPPTLLARADEVIE
jgi:putative tryptophan/tyrosine transport system substrate-binding protein